MLPPDLALDRPPVRTRGWVALDVLAAAMLALASYITTSSEAYASVYEPVRGLEWAFVFAPLSLIAVRRFAPATALLASSLLLLAGSHTMAGANENLAGPIIIYTVATSRPPSTSRWIVMVAAVPAAIAALIGPANAFPLDAVALLTVYAIAWIVGVRARDTQTRAERLEADAVAARAEAQAQAERAVDEERARIARELHDAVGHAVNVMVLQAGAARMAAPDPATTEALRRIEQVGRAALTDLDRMLGLLKADEDEDAPLAPQRGIDDLAELVAGLRATGRDVVLDVRADDLDPHLDGPAAAAAYRIVQEALTNVAKHAGPANVVVTVRAEPQALEVSIVDDGRGAAAPAEGGGRGLVGMRERAHVLGGTLEAAPCTGGGFAVTARLPREPER